MGIISGIWGVVTGAARAMVPKEEPPGPEPVQVQIVDGRQKTNKEQVRDWMNGGDEPDKVTRIKNNIDDLNNRKFEEVRKVQYIRGQRNSNKQSQSQRSEPMNFDTGFGKSRQRRDIEKRAKKRNAMEKANSSKKVSRKKKSNFNINYGKWKL